MTPNNQTHSLDREIHTQTIIITGPGHGGTAKSAMLSHLAAASQLVMGVTPFCVDFTGSGIDGILKKSGGTNSVSSTEFKSQHKLERVLLRDVLEIVSTLDHCLIFIDYAQHNIANELLNWKKKPFVKVFVLNCVVRSYEDPKIFSKIWDDITSAGAENLFIENEHRGKVTKKLPLAKIPKITLPHMGHNFSYMPKEETVPIPYIPAPFSWLLTRDLELIAGSEHDLEACGRLESLAQENWGPEGPYFWSRMNGELRQMDTLMESFGPWLKHIFTQEKISELEDYDRINGLPELVGKAEFFSRFRFLPDVRLKPAKWGDIVELRKLITDIYPVFPWNL